MRVVGRSIFVPHDRSQFVADPVSAGYAAVLFGHSHQALVETRDGVLYLNPGSAGPRRFRLPITVAKLRVLTELLEPEIVQLGRELIKGEAPAPSYALVQGGGSPVSYDVSIASDS